MGIKIMRLQKIVLAIVVVVTLGTQLGACRSVEIVGNWESDDQKGGIAHLLEIRSDGTLTSSMLVRIDRDYRTEGDKLIITANPEDMMGATEPEKQPAATEKPVAKTKKPADKKASAKQNKSEQDKSRLSLDQGNKQVIYMLEFNSDDKLKMTHVGPNEVKEVLDLKREGQAVLPGSIIGHWTFRHQTGKTAHMVFNANGSMHFRMVLPFGTDLAYEVKDNALMLYKDRNKKPVMSGTYKLEDGKLTVDDGKSITHFVHVDESKWCRDSTACGN